VIGLDAAGCPLVDARSGSEPERLPEVDADRPGGETGVAVIAACRTIHSTQRRAVEQQQRRRSR